MYIFGFSTNYIPVKTIGLTQYSCPGCGQMGTLKMTFLQMEQDGVVTQRLNKISAEVSCTSCQKSIPQTQWSDSLKGFFEAEKRNIKVDTSIKLSSKGRRVVAVIAGCLISVAGIFVADGLGLLKKSGKQPYEIERENTLKYIANPQVGDICRVGIFNVNDNKYTLFKIVAINPAENKITIAAGYKSLANMAYDDLPADEADFDTKDLQSFSLKDFRFSTFTNNHNKEATRINIFSIVRVKS